MPGMRGFRFCPQRGVLSLVEIAVFVVAIGAAFGVRTPHLADVAILTFLWAELALAWNIAGGYANLVSFGHAAFFGIGAYTSTILAGQFALRRGSVSGPARRLPGYSVRFLRSFSRAPRGPLHPVDACGGRSRPYRRPELD